MKTTVKANVTPLMLQLSVKLGRRFTNSEIAREVGVSNHAIAHILSGNSQRMNFKTIAGIIDFFNSHGESVGINDLFTVTREIEPNA